MDYLETDKDVDAKRVAIMGHSRLGKTVLWAGALDARFAMVLSSCSGEGGASIFRRNYGETVTNLLDVFPYWFSGNFEKYRDHANRLPVDAHELIALIAPRPVYITELKKIAGAIQENFWHVSRPVSVYRLLGAQDLGTKEMPPAQPADHAQHRISHSYGKACRNRFRLGTISRIRRHALSGGVSEILPSCARPGRVLRSRSHMGFADNR